MKKLNQRSYTKYKQMMATSRRFVCLIYIMGLFQSHLSSHLLVSYTSLLKVPLDLFTPTRRVDAQRHRFLAASNVDSCFFAVSNGTIERYKYNRAFGAM